MKKNVTICDSCGGQVEDSGGAGTMRFNPVDARRTSVTADLCENCATKLPGRPVARRGRRPKALSE